MGSSDNRIQSLAVHPGLAQVLRMRPPARPAAPLRPARTPSHLFGIDKAEAPAALWLSTLFDASNLRFTGAYIDGPALAGNPDSAFTSPARATTRHWMDRIRDVAD